MKALELQRRLQQLELQTNTALFSYSQAKVLFAEENEKTMYTALCRHTKKGVIENVCKGVWLNPLSQFAKNDTRLEELALLLRFDCYNYVSLETVLSQASVISQQMFSYLTVMTTGASKLIKASFGTIEFTHTKRSLSELSCYKIPQGHKLPWASVDIAYRDLKRVGRNVEMVDMNELQQINGVNKE
ncbi:MAG: hypothetical protein JKX78_05745 [Alteromonadaceae bacterium]|nr:hypothetical protein [Alteromonadaceae bacterium]